MRKKSKRGKKRRKPLESMVYKVITPNEVYFKHCCPKCGTALVRSTCGFNNEIDSITCAKCKREILVYL